MIYLDNFSLRSEDIQFLTPHLSNFDYYFVITIWPIDKYEEDRLRKTIRNYGDSQSVFCRTSKEYELFDIGFDLRQTEPKEIIEHLNNLNEIIAELALEFQEKQLSGQCIGIHNNCSSPTELQAIKYVDEVGTLIKYTLTSNNFGNLSYPPRDREVFHYFPSSNTQGSSVVPSSRLSDNEIIYEFGQERISKDKFFELVKALGDAWKTTPKIIENPNTEAFSAIFQWKKHHLQIIVSRYHRIEQMNICGSVKEYPKLGSVTMDVYSQNKQNLPVLRYRTVPENCGRFDVNSLEAEGVTILPLPKIEPFVKPRHVLITFYHK